MTGSARCESVPVSPWPGKCLAVGEHPVVLQPAHLGGDQAAHLGRVLAERAGVDDRVGGVVVDVRHRREGEVHADRAALERGDPPDARTPRCRSRWRPRPYWEETACRR